MSCKDGRICSQTLTVKINHSQYRQNISCLFREHLKPISDLAMIIRWKLPTVTYSFIHRNHFYCQCLFNGQFSILLIRKIHFLNESTRLMMWCSFSTCLVVFHHVIKETWHWTVAGKTVAVVFGRSAPVLWLYLK